MSALGGAQTPEGTGILPWGERVLWRSSPDPRLLTEHLFRLRRVAAYSVILYALWAIRQWRSGPGHDFLRTSIVWLVLVLITVGFLHWLAHTTARTSTYILTDRRIVMRVGIALEMTVNVPLSMIERVEIREFGDRSGEIVVTPAAVMRVGYGALWPHVRLRAMRHPQPVLRGLPQPQYVATLLSEAVSVGSESRPLAAAAPVAIPPGMATPGSGESAPTRARAPV